METELGSPSINYVDMSMYISKLHRMNVSMFVPSSNTDILTRSIFYAFTIASQQTPEGGKKLQHKQSLVGTIVMCCIELIELVPLLGRLHL